MSAVQLDLLSWAPPAAREKRKRSSVCPEPDCGCGQNIGFCGVWRDSSGVDYVECEACSTGPKFPYAGQLADFDSVWPGTAP